MGKDQSTAHRTTARRTVIFDVNTREVLLQRANLFMGRGAHLCPFLCLERTVELLGVCIPRLRKYHLV